MKKALIIFMAVIICLSSFCSCQPKAEKEEIPEWKTAYLEHIEKIKPDHREYRLIFLDGDDVPELYVSGTNEATGDGVCTYKNGKLLEQRLNRIGGCFYIEKSGELMNRNGSQGVTHTHAYKLTKEGFVLTFTADSYERVESFENGEYELSYECTVEGEPVSLSEHDAAIEAAFDYANAIRMGDNAVSYEEIIKQINDWE